MGNPCYRLLIVGSFDCDVFYRKIRQTALWAAKLLQNECFHFSSPLCHSLISFSNAKKRAALSFENTARLSDIYCVVDSSNPKTP